MKCNEPYPEATYQECQLDLGHSGQHDYFGTKWARPVPAEPDPDVETLLDRADRESRAWGTSERSYPVVIERTLTYVYWVDAESEDDALRYVANNSWEISLSKETPTGCSDEVRRLNDELERRDAFEAQHMKHWIGPEIKCPDCGALAFKREWMHDPYRKCHGPIEWRQGLGGRVYREYRQTPVYDAARTAVAS